jgi:hypothetical protein
LRGKKKQTRWERFLGEIEAVAPWDVLLAKLEPYYPKSGRHGHQSMPLPVMQRI